MSDVYLRPKRELQATSKIEKSYCAMFELTSNDAFRWQAKAVAVEGNRFLKVLNAKRQHCYSSFHAQTPTLSRAPCTRIVVLGRKRTAEGPILMGAGPTFPSLTCFRRQDANLRPFRRQDDCRCAEPEKTSP